MVTVWVRSPIHRTGLTVLRYLGSAATPRPSYNKEDNGADLAQRMCDFLGFVMV
jgi:hypothetical protein